MIDWWSDLTAQLSRLQLQLPASGWEAQEMVAQWLKKSLNAGKESRVVCYHDFLSDMLRKYPKYISREDKLRLLDSPSAFYMLSSDLIDDDETADILYYEKGFYNIIDVKTRNLGKRAQSPNIISSYKVAQMCAYMIENQEYDSIGIDYVGVDWHEDKAHGKLVCDDAQHVDLFRTTPSELYINWGAGLQIQFHPDRVGQEWNGDIEQWARTYLRHFVDSAQRRCDTMRAKFVEPFLKYLD